MSDYMWKSFTVLWMRRAFELGSNVLRMSLNVCDFLFLFLANVLCHSAKQRRPEQTMAIAGRKHEARLLMKSIWGVNSCESKK